jgi:hypothetical protein
MQKVDSRRGSWSRGRRVWQRKGMKVGGDMKREAGEEGEDSWCLKVEISDFIKWIRESEGKAK